MILTTKPTDEKQERHEMYWLGYRHGRRLGLYEPLFDFEPALRLEVQLLDGNPTGRAWALGELRGYREARDD